LVPPFQTSLLGKPGVEDLVEFRPVVGPPDVVEIGDGCGVVRIGGHMGLHLDAEIGMVAYQWRRRIAGRTVGDELRLIRQRGVSVAK